MLGGLRNLLNMDRRDHHSTDCLKEKRVGKTSGGSPVPGRQLSEFYEANITTAMKANGHSVYVSTFS